MRSLQHEKWQLCYFDGASHCCMQAHDSIEDACTALALHKVYQRLQATGDEAAKEALSKMYDFGQEVGWDPALWPRTPPPVFP